MFWDMADNWHTFQFDSSPSVPPETLYNKNYSFFRVQQYLITAYNIYGIHILHLWPRYVSPYFMEHSTSWKDRKMSVVKILVYCVMAPWYVVRGY